MPSTVYCDRARYLVWENQNQIQGLVEDNQGTFSFIWLTRISKTGRMLYKEPQCRLPEGESHDTAQSASSCTCAPQPEQVMCRVNAISTVEHYDPSL